MRRSLWVLVLGLLALGCQSRSPAGERIRAFEYQWGDAPRPDAWQSIDRLSPPPPGRREREDLWVRTRLPESTPREHAELYLDDPIGLREARLDGAPIYGEDDWPLLALPEASGGKLLALRFSSPHTMKLGPLMVGAAPKLGRSVLAREYDQFAIGALLAFVGVVLLAASARRPRIAAYAWFGLFSGALGLVTIGQTTLLARLVAPSAEFWRVAQSIAIYLYPIGFLRFMIDAFGDTPRRLFERLSWGLLAYLGLSLALDFLALGDIWRLKRAVFVVVLLTIIPIFRLMIPRAKTDRNARMFVTAFAVLFVIGLPDTLLGLGYPVVGFSTAHWGILAFTICLGLVVEGRVREQQVRLSAYSQELTERLGEVEALNLELRRQIAERSKELSTILSRREQLALSAEELAPGDRFAGRYRVLRPLGRGGMGAVYAVERESDGQQFALKLMTGRPTPAAAARFAREAEIAARIVHPSLVGVVDVGVEDGVVYLAMELVEGGALDDKSSRFGDARFARAVLRQVADALCVLHRAGVVHRDLKPANVLLVDGESDEPSVKVGDFGIARLGEEPPSAHAPTARQARLTQTGALMGTPQYMAPELAGGAERATPAVDVFAFGVMAYELFSGGYPFAGPPVYGALAGRDVPLLEPERFGELPHGELLRRCLDARPERRPSAEELFDAFAKAATGELPAKTRAG